MVVVSLLISSELSTVALVGEVKVKGCDKFK